MRKVGRAADEENGIAVYQAGDGRDVNTVGWGWAGDKVKFDLEVRGGFLKCCVGRLGDDPSCRQLYALMRLEGSRSLLARGSR